MRSFFGEPVSDTAVLEPFSGEGDGFLTMFSAPGRSARPTRTGVDGAIVVVGLCGESPFGVSEGMFEDGLVVMTTSSALLSLLFGLAGAMSSALVGLGEFSLRKDAGILDRAGSLVGVPYLPLPPFEDGVDAIGELGSDLSTLNLCVIGGSREVGGDQAGDDFCCETSNAFKSESELRLFFLGGCVGMKLGCSPIVDSPRLSAEAAALAAESSARAAALYSESPS